jgi:uncharacterized protein RhaS with RHS repeats
MQAQLHDNRFRTYDPAIGRYISADPIGQAGIVSRSLGLYGDYPELLMDPDEIPGELNLYSYVGNSPLNGFDEFGLEPERGRGGKQNVRDTGLADKTDDEISAGARDKSKSKAERKKYQKEEKARGLRNRARRGRLGIGVPSTYHAFCVNNPVECAELFGEPLPEPDGCTEDDDSN